MPSPVLDIRFTVEGEPQPKGNHQAFPIPRGKCRDCKPGKPCCGRSCFGGTIVGTSVTDKGGKALEAWEQLVRVRATSARNAAGQRMVQRPGALEISMVFVFARPASHWTPSGALAKAGRDQPLPTVKPDFDKVARAAVDGLTSAVVEDDAEIVVGRVAKVYAGWKGWTGVAIRARQISSYDAWVEHELSYHGVWSPPSATQGALL